MVAGPVVLSLLVCDTIIIDQETRKKSLIGLFDNVRVSAFPTSHRLGIYARLTEMSGTHRIQIRMVRLSEDSEEMIGMADCDPVEVHDPLQNLEIAMNLPPMMLPSAGRYEIQLWANDVYLGRATFRAMKAGD